MQEPLDPKRRLIQSKKKAGEFFFQFVAAANLVGAVRVNFNIFNFLKLFQLF
jgi:hypothetical protein